MSVRVSVNDLFRQWLRAALERGADGLEELGSIDDFVSTLMHATARGSSREVDSGRARNRDEEARGGASSEGGHVSLGEDGELCAALKSYVQAYSGGREQRQAERRAFEDLCYQLGESVEMVHEVREILAMFQTRLDRVDDK